MRITELGIIFGFCHCCNFSAVWFSASSFPWQTLFHMETHCWAVWKYTSVNHGGMRGHLAVGCFEDFEICEVTGRSEVIWSCTCCIGLHTRGCCTADEILLSSKMSNGVDVDCKLGTATKGGHHHIIRFCFASNLNVSLTPQWLSIEEFNNFLSSDLGWDGEARQAAMVSGVRPCYRHLC